MRKVFTILVLVACCSLVLPMISGCSSDDSGGDAADTMNDAADDAAKKTDDTKKADDDAEKDATTQPK